MNKRDIVIGLAILAGLTGLVYFWQKPSVEEKLVVPQTLSIEDQIEERFKLEIPEDVEKVELKDVSGGGSKAMATRKYLPAQAGENGIFTHTVLADLPEPAEGVVYEGWLVKGEEYFSTGVMRVAKGGYLLEYQSQTNYLDYNKVIITEEKKVDQTPERHLLEGSF